MTVSAPPAPLPPLASPALPATYRQAAWRALRGTCPRCGEAKLFRAFLKPVDQCPACAQDWSLQQADDFPAYVAIIVTGHLLAPIIIALVLDFDLSPGALLAVIVPLALALLFALLQPAKGAIIAAQWWHGLNGFVRERAAPAGSAQP